LGKKLVENKFLDKKTNNPVFLAILAAKWWDFQMTRHLFFQRN
jgi:hypothetical protein